MISSIILWKSIIIYCDQQCYGNILLVYFVAGLYFINCDCITCMIVINFYSFPLFQAVGKGAKKKGRIKRSDGSFSDASSNSLLRQVGIGLQSFEDLFWSHKIS